MKIRKIAVCGALAAALSLSPAFGASADSAVEANDLFSLSLPEALAGTYEVERDETGIRVYDKASREADAGGYAFGVLACADPSEYGFTNNKKVGELTAADGKLYDIVLDHPSDVQYDFTQGGVPEAYKRLYDAGEKIVQDMQGVNGSVYTYGAGTKGADLYGDVLRSLTTAVAEKWEPDQLEKAGFSMMYYSIAASDGAGRIGYAYRDINLDGIDELLIGEIAEGDWKGIIYDVYTIADRKPVHVVSGWDRSRYFLSSEGVDLINEGSNSAFESIWTVYSLEHNSAELYPQIAYKLDAVKNEKQPWFIAYGSNFTEDAWENVTEEEWKQSKSNFEEYDRFDYTPLTLTATDMRFIDVDADAWFYDAVMWSREHGITTGVSTDKPVFAPEGTITRAQIATFLWRAAGEPEPQGAEMPFADVEQGSWYEKAVLWAVEQGITNGTGEHAFGPADPCTRAHVLTFLYRLMGEPEAAGENPFTDVPAGEWYSDAVVWAVNAGVSDENTNGNGGLFQPDEACIRANIVYFLYQCRDALTR